jgi:hypothetical protein
MLPLFSGDKIWEKRKKDAEDEKPLKINRIVRKSIRKIQNDPNVQNVPIFLWVIFDPK